MHCDYADDIALTSNTAECLQFQLNKFHNYTRFKGLKLNTDDKTKIMVFFSKGPSAIPLFTYDGTRLELEGGNRRSIFAEEDHDFCFVSVELKPLATCVVVDLF